MIARNRLAAFGSIRARTSRSAGSNDFSGVTLTVTLSPPLAGSVVNPINPHMANAFLMIASVPRFGSEATSAPHESAQITAETLAISQACVHEYARSVRSDPFAAHRRRTTR